MADMVKVKRMGTEGKGKAAGKLVEAVKSIRGMFSTDYAGIVSQSQWSLERAISILVRVAGWFGPVMSERKTGDFMCVCSLKG